MITYDIKILDDSNFEEANAIFQDTRKVMRTRMTRDWPVSLTTENKVSVGAFFEGQLLAFVQVTTWPSLPIYNIGNLNIRKGFSHRYDFSNHSHPMIQIMNYIIREKESQGYYTWYYNRSLARPYHKLQLKGGDLLNNCEVGLDKVTNTYRYDRFIEEIVEPGSKAKYKIHEQMQGDNIYDVGFMIVKCCLKPQYRKTPNYFDENVIKECLQITQKTKNT
jgi:hypothetical protein